eukprot:164520-Karenia_brevis.AAC.1
MDQCIQACPLCGNYEGDTLGHLAVCQALASGVARAVNLRPPGDALQAFCMVGGESISKSSIRFVCVAYHTYHSLRGSAPCTQDADAILKAARAWRAHLA